MKNKKFKGKFLKKNILLILTFVALIFAGLLVYWFGFSKAAQSPVIFFFPHQDDEMAMAGGVRQHVLSGREVYVVMVTDGSSTAALPKINERLKSSGFPETNKAGVISSRNAEFTQSMRTLGVKADHIRFANKDIGPYFKDGSLTQLEAGDVIDFYYRKLGKGSYKALSSGIGPPISGYAHPDHKAIFYALRNFKKVTDKRYYNDKFISGLTRKDDLRKYFVNGWPLNIFSAKIKALNSYSVWIPPRTRYAVGNTSVPNAFKQAKENPYEYVIYDEKLTNALLAQEKP